jgi:heat shock protein HslJ
MRSSISATCALLLVVIACAKPSDQATPSDTPTTPAGTTPAVTTPAPASITDRDWTLTSLGERMNLMGQGDRAPTLRLDSAGSRASGFAGCNRFNGPFTLSGDSLSFGALVSTKMACAQGNDVEVAYLAALGNARTFSVSDSVLTLRSADSPLATFVAR